MRDPTESDIRDAIVELLESRSEGATICPSDAARALDDDEDAWRALMDDVRDVARAMVREGELVILQGGEPVDPDALSGPIRLGFPDG